MSAWRAGCAGGMGLRRVAGERGGAGGAIRDAGAASEYAQVEAAATAALTQASAAGFEWLHTRELLAQARAEADAGRYAHALELATTARTQAELALVQARAEATAWQARVPR